MSISVIYQISLKGIAYEATESLKVTHTSMITLESLVLNDTNSFIV